MDSSRTLASIAVLLCTLWLVAQVAQLPVWAVPTVSAGAPPPPAPAHGPISLQQAVRLVQGRCHCKVVRTETRQENGHAFYLLRVLFDSGHVRTVRVDAEDGSIH